MHTLSTRLRCVALSLVLLGSSSSPVWATPYAYRIYMPGIHGTSTQLTATPGSLAFGTVSEGQVAVRSFTLVNTGNAPTSPLTFSLPATVTQTNTCGASLAAGANCLVTATYAPTTTMSLTGSIGVSDQDSTAQVSVAGTGYAPTYAQWASGSGPNINIVGPQTIEFGNNESYPDWESGVANIGKSSGKWYFEIPLSYPAGIATGIMSNGTWAGTNAYIYSAPNGYYAEKGTVYTYTSAEQNYAGTVGYAVDLDDGTITFYGKNCQAVSPTLTFAPGGKTWYPVAAAGTYFIGGKTMTANFGQAAFNCPPPPGYNAGWYQ